MWKKTLSQTVFGSNSLVPKNRPTCYLGCESAHEGFPTFLLYSTKKTWFPICLWWQVGVFVDWIELILREKITRFNYFGLILKTNPIRSKPIDFGLDWIDFQFFLKTINIFKMEKRTCWEFTLNPHFINEIKINK